MNNNDKKLINICIVVIVIALIIAIVTKCLTGFTEKDKLEKSLSNLGNLYYQSVFYPSLANPDNGYSFLRAYTESGYKVNLANLLTSTEVEEEIFVLKGQKCNLEESYVLLYPQDPYGQKDIKVKAYLSCNE